MLIIDKKTSNKEIYNSKCKNATRLTLLCQISWLHIQIVIPVGIAGI